MDATNHHRFDEARNVAPLMEVKGLAVAYGRIRAVDGVNLTIGDDGTGKDAPALVWIHENCGITCHNANEGSSGYGAGMLLRGRSSPFLREPRVAEDRGESVPHFMRDPGRDRAECGELLTAPDTLLELPDLSQIGKKYPPPELLTHILEPSKLIDPKYTLYVVETVDGQVLNGLLVEKTDQEIVLKNSQNKLVRVGMKDVEQLAPQQKSMMPDLLLRDMTPQQAADLLAYLASLRE